MEIRKTRPEELDAVMALYDSGRAFMRRHGNQAQWINGYPARALVEADIRDGNSYVAAKNGIPTAAFCFFFGKAADPTYDVIDGAWLDDAPYGVIHRLASNGQVPGIMRFCSDWALTQCPSLRVDTHRDNHPMLENLLRLGFQYCGVIRTWDGTERVAYQKRA